MSQLCVTNKKKMIKPLVEKEIGVKSTTEELNLG